MTPAPVYVVHCVDTEGPLYESLPASFARLKEITGIEVPATAANLAAIRDRGLDLGGKEDLAAMVLSEDLLAYNDTWDKIDAMLSELLTAEFRSRYADPSGAPWTFSWFVVDHLDFAENPRRRDLGYHNVFDHYRERLASSGSDRDELNWHFHPMTTYREAHRCANSVLRTPHIWEVLSRRIIDRTWFPAAFRAGCHTERPDLHWFLEQWIPFDYSNQAMPATERDEAQLDLAAGRFGDWRRAPDAWGPYHPHPDDHQVPGQCNRWILRCLNVGTRVRVLTAEEVDRAFVRAEQGEATVLALTDHDFRDVRKDVRVAYELIVAAARKHPRVEWRHEGAMRAARRVLGLDRAKPIDMDVRFTRRGGSLRLEVETDVATFGPQPYLAVRTRDRRYLSDNFDLQEPRRRWSYVFDEQTILPDSIDAVGVAATGPDGSTCVALYSASGERITKVKRAA